MPCGWGGLLECIFLGPSSALVNQSETWSGNKHCQQAYQVIILTQVGDHGSRSLYLVWDSLE